MKLNFAPTFKYFNQEKTILGKKINVDTTKDLENQDWFKSDLFSATEKDFIKRHIGTSKEEQRAMLKELGYYS